MGMYTELNIGVRLKNLPQNYVRILNYLGSDRNIEIDVELPQHALFSCERWRTIGAGCSYYFDGQPHYNFYYDAIANVHFLTTRFNLKNYDGEIDKFLEWLCPYVDTKFCGYKMYELDKAPTLIYCINNNLTFIYADRPEESEDEWV